MLVLVHAINRTLKSVKLLDSCRNLTKLSSVQVTKTFVFRDIRINIRKNTQTSRSLERSVELVILALCFLNKSNAPEFCSIYTYSYSQRTSRPDGFATFKPSKLFDSRILQVAVFQSLFYKNQPTL